MGSGLTAARIDSRLGMAIGVGGRPLAVAPSERVGLLHALWRGEEASFAAAAADLLRRAVAQDSDVLKLAHVNAVLRTLPADAWVIAADNDELFAYPCNMPSIVRTRGHMVFTGQMVDRLALDGTIAPIRAQPSLPPPPSLRAFTPRTRCCGGPCTCSTSARARFSWRL